MHRVVCDYNIRDIFKCPTRYLLNKQDIELCHIQNEATDNEPVRISVGFSFKDVCYYFYIDYEDFDQEVLVERQESLEEVYNDIVYTIEENGEY